MRKLIVGVLLSLLCAMPAWASVTANSVVTAQTPTTNMVQLASTSSTATYYGVFTAGGNGARCEGVWESNSDSATHVITYALQTTTGTTEATGATVPTGGATTVNYAAAAITTGAGDGTSSGKPAVNVISATNWPGLPVDVAGNPYLQIPANMSLVVSYATAITASDFVYIFASCVNF